MKVSVILGHPDPASLNHAIARVAVAALKKNGHEVCRTFSVVVTTTEEQRREWLDKVEATVGLYFPSLR